MKLGLLHFGSIFFVGFGFWVAWYCCNLSLGLNFLENFTCVSGPRIKLNGEDDILCFVSLVGFKGVWFLEEKNINPSLAAEAQCADLDKVVQPLNDHKVKKFNIINHVQALRHLYSCCSNGCVSFLYLGLACPICVAYLDLLDLCSKLEAQSVDYLGITAR